MNLPEDQYMLVNGLRLHYLDWGGKGKQPILLLHGFTGHAHVWDYFAQDLRERYHVVALSQRGHGNSQWSQIASYTIDDHFADIAMFIEACGLNQPIIIGHSMGGRNALFFTACCPEKVSRLVLVDSRTGNDPEAVTALKRHISNIPVKTESIGQVVIALRQLYPFLPEEIGYHMAEYGFNREPDGAFVPKYDLKMGNDLEKIGFMAQDLGLYLKNITCPVLVVRGRESRFLSRGHAQEMCSNLSNARLEEIPFSSHMPVQENQEVFTRVLLDYLRWKS